MCGEVLQHRKLIVAGSIDRAILHLGAPAALSAVLQATFLVVDTFWIGRVGAVALAAVSTAGFVMWMAQVIGEGMATGAGAVLAESVGAGDRERASRSAEAGLALAIWVSLLVAGVGLVLARPVFDFMGTTAAVTEAGLAYMRVILISTPAYFLFAWIAAAFRGAGDSHTPLKLLGLAAAVNVAADPVLIFGVGPLPPLGATGAALATAASWIVSCVVGWVLLARLGLRPAINRLPRWPQETFKALRIGTPLAVEGALFSLIYILLTRVTTTFGTPAVAALGIGHKLEVFNYFVCAGMGAAATTLVGQNMGAGRPERAARAAWRTLYLTILPVGLVTMGLVTWPEAAVSVFITDSPVVAAGTTYVLLIGLSQVFMALEIVLFGAFAGAQWTTLPATAEISLTAARVPLAAWLVWLGWGVEGVWFAISSTTVIKALLLVALFLWRQGRGVEHDRAMDLYNSGGAQDGRNHD